MSINDRTLRLLLLTAVFVSLSLGTSLPSAHAVGRQLKGEDTWTLSVIYRHTATGWGSNVGEYDENGFYTDTFTVLSNSNGKLIISELKVATWTINSYGFFGSGQNGTNTSKYLYTINATTLNVISDSANNTGLAGQAAWMLIDPATLIRGAKLQRTWAPISAAPSFGSSTTVPEAVTGNHTIEFNGVNVQVWDLTYRGTAVGMSAFIAGEGVVSSTGQETDTTQFDHTYGILVGMTISGTYSGSYGTGGWTDTKSYSGQVIASNLDFSRTLPA